MQEELKFLMREAFGDSSSESDGESSTERRRRLQINDSIDDIIEPQSQLLEAIAEINGLWICRNFLSSAQHSTLLSTLEKEGYFSDESHNQAMRFGDLPCWAIDLSGYIRENILLSDCLSESKDLSTCPFSQELLWREPFFNQLIVNIYQPGEGICAHVDLMRFEDGIAIVSLESSCVMHFSSVEAEANKEVVKIPVLLTPGSLILMSGEARYLWKHEINRKPGFQKWDGQDIDQKRRTSITLRKLCSQSKSSQ